MAIHGCFCPDCEDERRMEEARERAQVDRYRFQNFVPQPAFRVRYIDNPPIIPDPLWEQKPKTDTPFEGEDA